MQNHFWEAKESPLEYWKSTDSENINSFLWSHKPIFAFGFALKFITQPEAVQ